MPQVNNWVDELLTAAETEGIDGVIEASGNILSEAVSALLNSAPMLVETATSLVSSFLGAVKESSPEITDGAIEVVMTMVNGFVSMVPDLISAAGELILGLLTGLTDHAPEIVETAGTLITHLASGLIEYLPKIVSAAGELISAIIDALADVDWPKVGMDIIRGIIDGIGAMAGALWDAATNIARSALDAIKSFFGISSPSKVTRDKVGKQIDAGIIVGMEEDSGEVENHAKSVSQKLIRGITSDVDYNLPDVRAAAKSLTADITSTLNNNTKIEVPVSIDGREVARATAWYMGEQLSWEER